MSRLRKVFVAGGTGLVGATLIQRLLETSDLSIRASRHQAAGPLVNDSRVEYVTGDLRSLDTCREMCRDCDCAIMAVAYTGGAAFVTSSPWPHIKENLWLNLQLLESFQLESIPRILFIGSATLYQDSEGLLAENDLDRNADPAAAYLGFGGSMRFLETICRMLHVRYGAAVTVIRAANVYGPFAKFDPAFSNVIPALIRKAVEKQDPFEVWGDPTVTRDVIFSEDFADAAIALALRQDDSFDIFNVGYGQPTSISEIVRCALSSASHKPASVLYRSDRPVTRRNSSLDRTKVSVRTGWVPRHTVEEGIEKTTKWWIENQRRWQR